MYTDFSF